MIKYDKLVEASELITNIRVSNAENVTIDGIRNALVNESQSSGLLVSTEIDQVKSGGMFNKSVEDCLVLSHPQHQKDYFKIVVLYNKQGNVGYVRFYTLGESVQFKKNYIAETCKADREGQSLMYKLGSKIGEGFSTLGRDKLKFQSEMDYYLSLRDAINNAFGVE